MKISSVQFIENHLLDSTNPEYSELCNEVLRYLVDGNSLRSFNYELLSSLYLEELILDYNLHSVLRNKFDVR